MGGSISRSHEAFTLRELLRRPLRSARLFIMFATRRHYKRIMSDHESAAQPGQPLPLPAGGRPLSRRRNGTQCGLACSTPNHSLLFPVGQFKLSEDLVAQHWPFLSFRFFAYQPCLVPSRSRCFPKIYDRGYETTYHLSNPT